MYERLDSFAVVELLLETESEIDRTIGRYVPLANESILDSTKSPSAASRAGSTTSPRRSSMADLRFSRATLAGLVTTVGARVLAFDDEAAALGLAPEEAQRLKRAMGFSTRHVVADPGTTTADLCLHSARHLLRGLDLQPDAVDGLILVTQTPDYSSPSTSIGMQHRLGMRTDTLCFDIRLGCSGFVYGLSVAYSLVESGLNRVLLCVGDVASRMVATGDRSITPIMGDAGAAVLIERRESESVFQLHSDGSGEKALFIPHSGLRADAADADKPAPCTWTGRRSSTSPSSASRR